MHSYVTSECNSINLILTNFTASNLISEGVAQQKDRLQQAQQAATLRGGTQPKARQGSTS